MSIQLIPSIRRRYDELIRDVLPPRTPGAVEMRHYEVRSKNTPTAWFARTS